MAVGLSWSLKLSVGKRMAALPFYAFDCCGDIAAALKDAASPFYLVIDISECRLFVTSLGGA